MTTFKKDKKSVDINAYMWRHDEKQIKINIEGQLTYISNDPNSVRYQPVTYKILDDILKANDK